MTGRVTGVGGIFFRCADPDATKAWYAEHMGLPLDEHGFVVFSWEDDPKADGGSTVWSPFAADTTYFGDSGQEMMINLRVDDLEALLAKLAAAGVTIAPEREDAPWGKFAWVTDPDGRRVELWQPPAKD